jgi:hypothetical protein
MIRLGFLGIRVRRWPRSRRFSPPWLAGDAAGQALAYIYSRDSDADARQVKALTAGEARGIVLLP